MGKSLGRFVDPELHGGVKNLASVRAIQAAFANTNEKVAASFVEERTARAPETNATGVLRSTFPAAAKPLPDSPRQRMASRLEDQDTTTFHGNFRYSVQHAPAHCGAGWGGSHAEFWNWAPHFEKGWEYISAFLSLLPLATDMYRDTTTAFAGGILARDKTETGKVRPLGRGVFFRKCINGAKHKTFKARFLQAAAPFQYAIGGTRTAERLHKTAFINLDSRPSAGLRKFDMAKAHREYERSDAALQLGG